MMASSSSSFTLSSVTVAVDKATSELLLTPDWTMNIAICDSVNSRHWQGKDAIKAVKRRLQHKNAKVQLLALTLLEAMVKNCGEHLHSQIAERHLLGEMVKIVVRKKGDFEVRNKILILLDTWNEAFDCRYPHYNWAYEELRRAGIRFPERSREAALMLRTSKNARPQSSSGHHHLLTNGSFRRLDETMAIEIESLSLSSLESMRNVMGLLNEMVQAVNTADSSALKDELIVDLVDRCRSNQKKLIQMLTTTTDEEVLAEGLELNDSMQGVLARHDAIASGVSLLPSHSARPSIAPPPPPPQSVASSSSNESESEEDEDGHFARLAARRHLQIRAEEGEEEALLLLGTNDNTTAEAHEEPRPGPRAEPLAEPLAGPRADLALWDEGEGRSKTKAEQDMMELLSLTITTTALPSKQPERNEWWEEETESTPEQMLLNSYVVPWAQSQAYQEPEQQKGEHNMVASQFQGHQQNPKEEEEEEVKWSYGYPPPPPPWAGGGETKRNTKWRGGEEEKVGETHLHYSNSFPARGSNTESSSANMGRGQNKPYIPPYRFFEDLNVLRNSRGEM